MNLSRLFFSISLLSISLYSANVNVTTKYGKTGGIVGPLNTTGDKVNGRDICPNSSTPGCDFSADPKFNNNNTVDDPSDDSYNGDLIIRTNDNFEAIAGWTWKGNAGGAEEVVTITGTLPLKDGEAYYEWAELPGSCNPANSSISDDKQTIVCERKDFDKNDAGTYSEDLTFNVRVKGGTPNGMKPGDIKFKVEAPSATAKEDSTDGNSLTVTASPRWNLDKAFGAYSIHSGEKVTINGEEKTGFIIDYRILVETDEVNGEVDNVYSLLGNESLGKDATITFKDDISGISPNATLLDCRTTGRAYSDGGGTLRDGYNGSNLPISFSGTGSIKESQTASHIPQPKGEQVPTCTQNGSTIDVKIEHVDATLDHYPTKDYYNRDLPVNRAIASILTMSIFVPLDDVKAGENGVVDCDGYGVGKDNCDDGEIFTENRVTNFKPVSASGVQNFAGQGESEKDNYVRYTLYYSAGGFDKYYWGDKNSVWNGPAGITHARQGDRFVGKGYEWSSRLYSVNRGGTDQNTDSFCDVIDANYMEIIKYGEKTNYTDTRYSHEDDLPFIVYTGTGKGNPDNHFYSGAKISDYYDIEFAGDYEDDSFLPSNNNNRQDNDVRDYIRAECNATASKWYKTIDEARANSPIGAVTKVRWRLKDGKVLAPGEAVYWMLLHRVREKRADNGEALKAGDMMVNYGVHMFDGNKGVWSTNTYIPHGLDGQGMPENFQNGNGDRMFYTGAKVRIKKSESRTSASTGDEVTYTLDSSYTDDIGSEGLTGDVRIVDLLPKDFKYKQGSVSPSDEFSEPTIGTCADVLDINSTISPCKDGENQVLIWDLGQRPVNAPQIPDLNYTVLIGAAANVGTNTNVVKIESSTDASPISQRKADIGLNINIPASINIVKTTEENPDYPSKRERTTQPKDIFFNMDMRNGKDGDITDLDVIDILPFEGDGDDEAIKFNDLKLKRKVATSYHGTMSFHEASFNQHPNSNTACDTSANRGVKYYYTNVDPKTINMAPTVGDENEIGNAKSIWCEGDESGPNGCTIESSGFTFSSNSEVTAVRARGPRMEKQAICQFKVHITVYDNLAGDVYSNSAGSSATGVTLPVLSNSLAVPIVGSSLGDYVWYDRNANGIQDENEKGIAGVKVKLLDGRGGNPVKNPANPTEDYVVTTDINGKYSFTKLNQGSYIVEFVKPNGFLTSDSAQGNSAVDSNIIDKDSSRTGTITLGVDEREVDVDAGFYTPIISGHIFDDGNGDGTVNGIAIGTADGTPLYVTLLDENNNILASKAVSSDGTYSFDGEDNVTADTNYSIVLSTSLNVTTSILPVNWNNSDGEHIGTDIGLDDVADGIISVSVAQADVPEVNFGINKKPEAEDVTKAVEFNPGGTTQVDVPDLNVSDKEDGTPTTITIKTLPNNGKLYYNGNEVTAGQVIPNFDNAQLRVDPDSGEQIVKFTYTTTDKVGVESDPATVTMPFKDLKISGHLFIDGNGDGNVNGTVTSTADGVQLYVTLLKDGKAIASKPLSSGAYEFNIEDGVEANTDFTVVLSETNGSTIASLPVDWDNNDGENINSQGVGNDGSKDGILAVNVVETDVTQADFGINKKPEAHDVDEPEQVNPGTKGSVDVPDLNISDSQSTNLDVNFTSVPNNATLYYNGDIVHAGDVIENFDNSLLTIDPEAGDQNVSFDYSVRDEAGAISDVATVTMSFKNIIISGKVFNDGNGNGNVDGTPISKADDRQLYVTLVDSRGTPVSSKALDSNGTYYFDSIDGLSPDTNYTVVLTDTENSKDATLPTNWNNADGENIGLVGLDENADGRVAVEVLRSDISEINFGINLKPKAEDRTASLQVNPGGTIQVVVPDLNITDRENGKPTTITITELPTNATLYYNGVAVEANKEIIDFDASKFTIDPNNGDLTAVFKYTTTDSAGVVSSPATETIPFQALRLLGNVFNDGNNDGIVNGIGISAPSGTQLYVTLLDSRGRVLTSKEVSGDGSYMFGDVFSIVANRNYRVVLSTTPNSANASLPTNWSNLDGEHIGRGKGTDGSNDGEIAVSVAMQNVVDVNFGINKKPVAGDLTVPLQLNPGGSVRVDVPNLLISDNEDTNLKRIVIESLPKHGTLYYNGVKVVVGDVINNSSLTIDPDSGDQTVSFTYSTIDSVGDKSEIATVSMSFDGLEIKGNIFDDGNNDGRVNGKKISKVGSEQLYVTLLSSGNDVVSSKAIKSDGSFLFEDITPNSSYSIILSTEANATTSKLPVNWNHADGEEIAMQGRAGLDGVADGKIVVDVSTSDVVEVNLGINARPIAVDKVENLRINPGSNRQVSVPKLEVKDREDGKPKTIVITKLPTNGVLYYNGEKVTKDATISSVDVSKFTIDPNNGDVDVIFEYVSVDSTGWHSKPATVKMPFYGLKISGKVFLDTNGDNKVDGMPFSSDSYGLQVYANLVDSNGVVVKSVAVDGNGEYIFDTTTGVSPNSDYRVVLSSEQNTTQATLPNNWEHTDHNTNGVIEVHVAISNVENINFGLNKQPVVHNVVAQEIVNPNGNRVVNVPNLEIEPNEDGNTTATMVRLSNLPSNATLYYNGVKVTEGQSIDNFDNSLLVVDPDDYNLTVEFTYSVEDSAGFESEPATVTMPFADSDSDGDGVLDGQDLDDDNDGILDRVEESNSLNGGDSDGDGIPDRLDLDSDGDGILDLEESNPNSKSVDSNSDGILDSTTDIDRDGVMDTADADDNNPTSKGSVTPIDTDKDGQPDFQDIDSDNDGLSDIVEGGVDATKDSNFDGILDNLKDSDGDGIADVVDSDNGGTPATTPDTDKDGKENYRDLDSDGDTILDVVEINGTDSNHDGHIEPVGALVDGVNLPDENNNGIPDIIEMKLKDDIKTVPVGSIATINLLDNDDGDIAPDSVKLIIPKDFKGVARISADGKRVVVDGEGEWYVDDNGVVIFKPEDGFEKSPTPIKYQASTKDGSKTSIATITLKVTDVAGVSEDCCETYTDNSVPALGIIGLILMVVFSSAFGAILLTKREE